MVSEREKEEYFVREDYDIMLDTEVSDTLKFISGIYLANRIVTGVLLVVISASKLSCVR